MAMVVKGAKLVLPDGVEEADLKIEEGRIVEIGTELSAKRSIRFDGGYILPALVDTGVGLKEGRLRGATLRELAETGRRNGFGTLAISALLSPRIDNEITLEFVRSQTRQYEDTRILPLLSGIDEEGGLSDCAILLKEGAVGIEFESHIDGNLIRRLMEYARLRGVTLFCHPFDPALVGEGVMHEGRVSAALGVAGIPPLAEYSQVARIGAFAQAYEVNVVILGASTPQTLQICRQNPYLHPQVSIHHLLLEDGACDDYDTAGKLFPPLRDAAAKEAMLEALRNGEVAMLSALHSPVGRVAKDAVFSEAAFGIDGLEGFLPLVYTYLLKRGYLDWPRLVRLCATAPAETIGLKDVGRIAVGARAELIYFDPTKRYTFEGPFSPYRGVKAEGGVEFIRFC